MAGHDPDLIEGMLIFSMLLMALLVALVLLPLWAPVALYKQLRPRRKPAPVVEPLLLDEDRAWLERWSQI